MSIHMMVGKEKAGLPNVETVHNFPGAESKYIFHAWGCPHRDNQLDLETSPDCLPGCQHREPLYMETSFVGCVLSVRERNWHDDSDFYALVWDDAKGAAYEIEYATTRGWTYPNGAKVDATPEVIAKYNAWLRVRFLAEAKRRDEELSKVPSKGKTCKVVAGRKIAKGTVVEVLRVYTDSFRGIRTDKAVVKFSMPDGRYTQVHTATSNLEVLDPTQYLSAEPKLQEAAYYSADCQVAGMFRR